MPEKGARLSWHKNHSYGPGIRISANIVHQGKLRGWRSAAKICVCWDAAVCAVSVGGFFSVWSNLRMAKGWRPVFLA